MRGIPVLGIGLALSVACSCADAVSVYRCTATDGAVSFQDRPCDRGRAQHVIGLPDDPPAPAAAPVAVDAPATAAPPATVVPTPSSPSSAPPGFFLCTRYDGSRYLSEDGVGSRSAVPFGMLAGSGRNLADAYGGPDGIGISAPGMREVPTIPSSQAPLAGAYVWIEDQCHYAEPPEACAWLRSRLDEVGDSLKRAFSDTAPQLKQEQTALRERMRGC